jgi:acyl carrier protein
MNVPFLVRRASLALSTPYVAPVGELELQIAGIFAEVFTLDHIGANDDFYDLGGDSLLAEVLSLAISERTGHRLEMHSLFKHSSPRQVAAFLKTKSKTIS